MFTVAQIALRARQYTGDLSGSVWAEATVIDAIRTSCNNSYPNFFRYIIDNTYTEVGLLTGTYSLVGSTGVCTITGFTPRENQLLQLEGINYYASGVSGATCKLSYYPYGKTLTFSGNTTGTVYGDGPVPRSITAIPVPSAFLYGNGNDSPGAIDALLSRKYEEGKVSTANWARIKAGLFIEPLILPAPVIRMPSDWYPHEIVIYGRKSCAVPKQYSFTGVAGTTITITGRTPTTPTAGETVVLAGNGLPAPLLNTLTYFVVNPGVGTCGLALTPGGTAITLTTSGYGNITFTSDTIENTEIQGYDNYLGWMTASNLHALAEKSPQYDRRDHGKKRLLAAQEAQNVIRNQRQQLQWAAKFDY